MRGNSSPMRKPDPNQRYVRPEWDQVLANALGAKVVCDCGDAIAGRDLLKRHWAEGHFDFWEKVPDACV